MRSSGSSFFNCICGGSETVKHFQTGYQYVDAEPVVPAFAESATGIRSGGRTGITALMVAFWFFVALWFTPLIGKAYLSSLILPTHPCS